MPTTIVGTFHHGQGFLEKLQSTRILSSGLANFKDILLYSNRYLIKKKKNHCLIKSFPSLNTYALECIINIYNINL